MSSVAEVAARCQEALQAMYSQRVDPEAMQAADQYLTWVVDQPIAWEVLDTLLNTGGMEMQHYFWVANSLLSCLLRRFKELPTPEVRASFRDSLLQHLDRFIQSSAPQVCNRLARCAGALAFHLLGAGEWAGAIEELAARYSPVPQALPPLVEALANIAEQSHSKRAHIVVTAELRAAAAAEADAAQRHPPTRGDLRARVRSNVHAALRASSGTALDVLARALAHAAGAAQQNSVFRCLADWACAGCVDFKEFQGHPLIEALFQAVREPELTVSVSDTLAGLLKHFRSSSSPSSSSPTAAAGADGGRGLLRAVAASVLQLMPLFQQYVADGAMQEAAALGSIYAELASAALDDIAPCGSDSDSSGAAAAGAGDMGLAVYDALVTVLEAKHPENGAPGAAQVAAVTFHFFDDFSALVEQIDDAALRGMRAAEQEVARAAGHAGAHPQAEARLRQAQALSAAVNRRLEELAPITARAVTALVESMQFPPAAHACETEDIADTRAHRKLAAGALRQIAECVGLRAVMDTLWPLICSGTTLYAGTADTPAGAVWQPLEAGLYAVRMSLRLQGHKGGHSEREVFPQVFSLLGQLRGLFVSVAEAAARTGDEGAAFGQRQTRYTATVVVGQYAHLIDSDETLTGLLAIVTEGLTAEGDVADAAAQALRWMSEEVASPLGTVCLPIVYEAYDALPGLSREAQKNLLTAVVNVVTAMPDEEQFIAGLNLVVGRLVEALGPLLTPEAAAAAPAETASSVLTVLSLVSHAIQAVNPRAAPEPRAVMRILVTAVQALAPSLSAVLTAYGSDPEITEAVVAVWRMTMKECGCNAWPIATEICDAACAFFERRPSAGYVYLADRFIATFANANRSGAGVLDADVPFDPREFTTKLLTFFAERVPPLIAEAGSVDAHPEIADDFVALGMTATLSCPSVYLSLSAPVEAMVSMARQSLQATHKDAHASAARFYDTLFTAASVRWHQHPSPELTTLIAIARSEAAQVFIDGIASAGGSRRLGDSLFALGLMATALHVADMLATDPPAADPTPGGPTGAEVIAALFADPRLEGIDPALQAEMQQARGNRRALRAACAHVMHALKGEDFEDDADW
jgi:hypothetical protein